MPEPAGDGVRATELLSEAPRLIAGRYEVVRVLGEGSSGRTLLCDDRRENRRVAVKELRLSLVADWKYFELFEREAKMLSKLDDPRIPKLYDYFEEAGAGTSFYIVQEFIEGVSLQQRMEVGPMLAQQEIHRFALEMLEVLDYLHGRAPPVVHRDIKPSNVLLRTDGRLALVDFGSVNVGWLPPSATGKTVVGTFGYMPPEQLMGHSGPASDLYALGATLLHLASGTPPSEFPFDSGRIEVPATLPMTQPLRRLIEALLRPAPRDRPQTAEAARRILTSDRQVPAPLILVGERVPTPARRPDRPSLLGTGGEPRFVDMGEPPRDPHGELRDVYRNLIHPSFPTRRAWSDGEHLFWLAWLAAGLALTMGGSSLLYAWNWRNRVRKYDELFREGRFTHGVVRSVVDDGMHATFKFEFEVATVPYIGYSSQYSEMKRYWNLGELVPVLYDADDPTRCCLVYR